MRAGILDERDTRPDVVAEIRRDPHISEDQKKTLIHIYESFRGDQDDEQDEPDDGDPDEAGQDQAESVAGEPVESDAQEEAPD